MSRSLDMRAPKYPLFPETSPKVFPKKPPRGLPITDKPSLVGLQLGQTPIAKFMTG
jgi:hypothetical protein